MAQPFESMRMLPNALAQIDHFIVVACQTSRPKEQQKAIAHAGMWGCYALTQVADDEPLWGALIAQCENVSSDERLRQVDIPNFARLLEAMGYKPPEDAVRLVKDAQTWLRAANPRFS